MRPRDYGILVIRRGEWNLEHYVERKRQLSCDFSPVVTLRVFEKSRQNARMLVETNRPADVEMVLLWRRVEF